MVTGIVKWFSPDKAYGFIKPDSDGDDVFVHARDIKRVGIEPILREGDRVSFDVVPSDRHPGKFSAANVEILENAAAS